MLAMLWNLIFSLFIEKDQNILDVVDVHMGKVRLQDTTGKHYSLVERLYGPGK